ncbi:MAG: protein translocase subunit SecD [Lachnospiraceae bacterium]|nr:protein translocase subunit SecD [Lachnospiraceae bacterium]
MKVYSKRRSIISLCLFAALFALVLFTVLHGFGYENSGSVSDIKLGLDLRGGVSITYQAVGDTPSQQDMDDTIQKMQTRAAEYSNEAQVYQEGSNRITIDIPGKNDAEEVLSELGQPGTLIFATDYQDPTSTKVIDGNNVTNAQAGYDSERKEYIVQLSLDEVGQKKFALATKELAGTGKPIYIIYDGAVISNPTCEEEINSPTCQISGNMTYESASTLASYIRIGALPVELEELRSQVVGATLGSQAISTSIYAALIGLAIIIVLMIVLYRLPGFCAALALIAYTALIMMLLAGFNDVITLTLPGIAGIILSIGMAVDANVIIFSRVREEIGRGSKVPAAIDAGFSKALSAIIDGNVTTLIAAVVLFAFGSGTVKGFATTLALGIILSMVTALFITRLLIKSFYALGFKDAKWYGKTEHKKDIDFLSKRNIFFAASCAVVVIGIAAMIINASKNYALNYSLDFIGGTSTDVTFNETRSIEQLEAEVEPVIAEAIGSTDITLTPVVGGSEVIIKTQELTQDQREALYKVLEEKFSIDTSTITYENISGVVSAEMARSAVISVILATIAMLLYIWIRFRDIRFAGSSIMALVHDVLVVLACYAVFRWTVGNTFIACMLTLVGYSINATIVIFDRIRENISLYGDSDLKMIVNKAITDTLGRSIYTSLTTFVMVAALYIFGVTSIREFALPLMVGILVGGYSSVCLAGAFWYTLRTKFAKKSTTPAKSTKNVKNAKKK